MLFIAPQDSLNYFTDNKVICVCFTKSYQLFVFWNVYQYFPLSTALKVILKKKNSRYVHCDCCHLLKVIILIRIRYLWFYSNSVFLKNIVSESLTWESQCLTIDFSFLYVFSTTTLLKENFVFNLANLEGFFCPIVCQPPLKNEK